MPEQAKSGAAMQEEMPFAIVQGVPLSEVPRDLYIPPDALEVFLEAFAGPLDLLLYLIKRQNLDILNIPIARVTEQYMNYIELMEVLQLELAGEYLVMAAMLAEIKSRMLLPRPQPEADEEDPRAELVRRLQEYEIFKQAAQDLDDLPRLGRDCLAVLVDFPGKQVSTSPPEVALDTILQSFGEVLRRAEVFSHHRIQREPLSVRARMVAILDRLETGGFTHFHELFIVEEGRPGVIVVLLALLELAREALVEIVQNDSSGPIYVRAIA